MTRLSSILLISSLIVSSAVGAASSQPPIPIILDTDMYGDIDDALTLAMLHGLQDRAEVKLLAVTVTTEAPWIAPYIDAVDTYYGHVGIPIGMVHGGVTALKLEDNSKPFREFMKRYAAKGHYTQYVSQLTRENGALLYPRQMRDGSQAEDAVALLRKVLIAQPDHSVVMIQVGFSTNFAKLLKSERDGVGPLGGRALIQQKVRLLSMMGGRFAEAGKGPPEKEEPEFNIATDISAARTLFAEWPTSIVVSGNEIGGQMLFPQARLDRLFNAADHHPVAESYDYIVRIMNPGAPEQAAAQMHATFDLTSALYAIRPDDDYFSLSAPGTITVLANGITRFEAVRGGLHRYLMVNENQKARALEAMLMLASQPARRREAKECAAGQPSPY